MKIEHERSEFQPHRRGGTVRTHTLSVLVENKPGAGGRLVVDILKNSPADGSVVMLGPDALTALYPFTFKKLSYDPAKDLVPVGTVAEFPFAMAAGADGLAVVSALCAAADPAAAARLLRARMG